MTSRRNYPRLRNGQLEGEELPPHFLNQKKQETGFDIKGGFPTTMAIPRWMKSFADNDNGVVVRREETFYKLRGKIKE